MSVQDKRNSWKRVNMRTNTIKAQTQAHRIHPEKNWSRITTTHIHTRKLTLSVFNSIPLTMLFSSLIFPFVPFITLMLLVCCQLLLHFFYMFNSSISLFWLVQMNFRLKRAHTLELLFASFVCRRFFSQHRIYAILVYLRLRQEKIDEQVVVGCQWGSPNEQEKEARVRENNNSDIKHDIVVQLFLSIENAQKYWIS